ncbi:hypothetical protein [Paenibacillus xylanexedens]|uniref:Uncharacterized protein n=1 Tax=Paenibacillus xylanexedens TaxID=528191 RepID=A0ABS4RR07_PAEXY|nr:hypothetical protein [Paenibacillus xylanexedens]MBP2245316.1 hypothetical protein [Paenibacillus xylanexedens]
MQKPNEVRYDPYFSEIPWDIIKDDRGKVIGEVYLVYPKDVPEWKKPRKKVRSYHQYNA